MIMVGVLALFGVAYLTVTSGTEEVYVAAVDLLRIGSSLSYSV
jgi:hypothetical protein